MYRWTLIFLIIPAIAFGQITDEVAGVGADTSLWGIPLQDTTGNLTDNDVVKYDVATNTWLYEPDAGAGGGSIDIVWFHNDADDDSISSEGSEIHLKFGVGIDAIIAGDTSTVVVDETEFNAMYNDGDTVTGTYNYSDNPLEAITMIDFDDDMSTPAHQEARIFYDPTDNTLSVYNNEADITLNVGQEGWVYARNVSGSTILDGKVVYVTGAVSSRPTIQLAQADAEATCKLIGVATHDIETATNGYVTLWGTVHGIDLSDFSDGNEVFLSATVAGSLTTVAPSAPNCVVEVGHVVDASVNGDLLVLTGKNKTLNLLSDVLISGPATGNILVYDGTVWADTAGVYLPLTGGTMVGNIDMNDYDITDADLISSDSIVVGEDTLYNEHIIAYLMRLRVRNASGATLSAGTPVYISGITGNRPNVDSARADNVALMPAVGLIEHDINNNADGFVVISGEFGSYNTVAWSVQDPLYVGATGGLTSTKPTGANLIQKMGIVTRDNATVGTIQLVGAGRTNDLPNIASANFWLGDGSAVPTAVTMSGDATMDNAGAVTIGTDKINDTHIDWGVGANQVSIIDIPAVAWRVFYSNGSGVTTELALGSSGQVLKSNGATSAPTWQADATGSGIWSEGTDTLFAIDSDGDTIAVFWDDDAGNVRWQTATEDQTLRILIDTLGMGGDVISELAGTGLTVVSNELTADLGTSIDIDEIDWEYEYIYLDVVHGWGRAVEDSSYLTLPIHDGSSSYLFTDYATDISPTHNDTVFVSGVVPFDCSVDSVGWVFKETGIGQMSVFNLYGRDKSDAVNMTDSLYYTDATDREPGTSWTKYTQDITDIVALKGDRFAVRFVFEFDADNDSMHVGWVRLAVRR